MVMGNYRCQHCGKHLGCRKGLCNDCWNDTYEYGLLSTEDWETMNEHLSLVDRVRRAWKQAREDTEGKDILIEDYIEYYIMPQLTRYGVKLSIMNMGEYREANRKEKNEQV